MLITYQKENNRIYVAMDWYKKFNILMMITLMTYKAFWTYTIPHGWKHSIWCLTSYHAIVSCAWLIICCHGLKVFYLDVALWCCLLDFILTCCFILLKLNARYKLLSCLVIIVYQCGSLFITRYIPTYTPWQHGILTYLHFEYVFSW